MTRSGPKPRGLWLVLLALLGCGRAQDVYIGSDFQVTASDAGPAPAGHPADAGGGGSGGGAALDAAPPSGTDAAAQPVADAGPPVCAPGFANCDGDPENGCEVDTRSDRLHCGGCGVACATADCECENGTRVLVCGADRGDCDGDPDNGCEVDLLTDVAHCGACEHACRDDGAYVAGAACSAGTCVLTCQPSFRWGDCDGETQNGCETDLFHDPDNCGECGMQCTICADSRCL